MAVVVALIVICTGIEAVLIAGDLNLFPSFRLRQSVYENLGFWPGLLEDWRPNYRFQPALMFLTYGFLHSGIVHLAVNMITLVSLGRALLARISTWQFLILYAASILGGAAGFALLSDSYRPMVGASGALFGLAGAILAWEYVDRFTFRERLWPVLRAALILIVLNVVLYFAMDRLLAWEAHLGGFVAGWITALLIDPRGRPTA
ncbi:rhomboid family intramembrane serine protease [Alphaproteobacteria bacterium GH1-50]|uniref:Rhomboid family intramembrane serine protease n=1 Tax=Kangsaoukella pontilimi TaxID=2691042 RepID=A0A7C9MDE6_9RHOB|nr:rhomboid family intramembrane serine protease [Kangsaoukella pontilimi]MXQ06416.1 rhomboid family intramembrane serine protease [Kangsaoukella pontilimi]